MFSKEEFKRLFRSGSFRFVCDGLSSAAGRPVSQYVWRRVPIYYRPGTSDPALIYSVLLKRGRKSEYWVPKSLDPTVVLDIGANIGISSIYFSNRFPRAKIYAFEPVPENVALLSRNLAYYRGAHISPVALGRTNGTIEMLSSDNPHNFGGFSFYDRGSDPSRKIAVKMRQVNTALRELGIYQVDLIKIDTEGAEYDILTAFDENLLRSVKWIMGELHGERDFELLAFLSQWFDIETKKSLKNRLFMFRACNKLLTQGIDLR